MSDGTEWIGEYIFEEPSGRIPGMLGSISLTAARGVEVDDFLVRLGADQDQLDCGDLYKGRFDLARPSGRPTLRFAMYGVCGEWLYVLEDWGAATWYVRHPDVPAMDPRTGEEIVCLTMNSWDPPQRIFHGSGDGRVWQAEFGEDTGNSSGLDAALRESGAVFPTIPEVTAPEAEAYSCEHLHELPPAVFAAVGDYCGLTIDRAMVEAGDLPLVILPTE